MNNTLWGLRAAPNKKSNFSRVNFMPKMQNLKDPQFFGALSPQDGGLRSKSSVS
jgi:hypothetical protein